MYLTSVLQQPEEARWSRRAAALLIIYPQHLASCPSRQTGQTIASYVTLPFDFVGKPTLHV
jgi:hypothetical protein